MIKLQLITRNNKGVSSIFVLCGYNFIYKVINIYRVALHLFILQKCLLLTYFQTTCVIKATRNEIKYDMIK